MKIFRTTHFLFLLSAVLVQIVLVEFVLVLILVFPHNILGAPIADLVHYYALAQAYLHGDIALRLLPLEYPLAALPLMLIPDFFVATFDHYVFIFILEIIIWNVACFILVVQFAKRIHGAKFSLRSGAWYTLWLAILTPLWAMRIDIPTATLLFASFLLLANRSTWAAVLGVIGGYMKLVPLIAVVAALRQRHPGRVFFSAAILFLFLLGLWALIAFPSMIYGIRYHLDRGIEIGSLYSGVLFIVGKIVHWPMSIEFRYMSSQFSAPFPNVILTLIPLLQVGAVLYPFIRLPSGTHQRNLRLMLAMLLGYIIFGKVLSPQYILWLVPFYAVLAGHQAGKQKIVFTLVCLSTTLLYPYFFRDFSNLSLLLFAVLNIRNALLLYLYWQTIRSSAHKNEAAVFAGG